MKKLKPAILIVAILMSVCLLASCIGGNSDTDSGTTSGSESAPSGIVLVGGGKSNYSIIHSSDADSSVSDAAKNLQNVFKKYFGADIEVKSDINPESEYEILIGDTNRQTSESTVSKYMDYEISTFGKKVVINGASDIAITKAVDYFIIDVIKAFDGNDTSREVKLDEKFSYIHNEKYPLEKISIGNSDISEYTVIISRVADDAARELADDFCDVIGRACGALLEIKSDRVAESEKEIVIGDSMRQISTDYYINATVDVSEYSYHIKGEKLIMVFGGKKSASMMASHIQKTLKNAEGSYNMKELDGFSYLNNLEEELVARYEGTDLRVMTNNILFTWSAAPAERAKYLSKIYHEYLPDILCLQEVNPDWYDLLPQLLEDEYTVVNAYPSGASSVRSNLNPILYRSDRLQLIEKNCYTTIPEHFNSEITYAVFRDKTTDKNIIVYSIHLLVDSLSATAEQSRQASTSRILSKIEELKRTYNTEIVFVMGDFNAVESTGTYKMFTQAMSDAKYVAEVRANTTLNTGHTIGQMPLLVSQGARNYDYIMVNSDAVKVFTHDIITNQYALDGSDHCPVYIDVKYK